MASAKKQNSHAIILDCYQRFHNPIYLKIDPLSVVRRYLKSPHREWIALIGALFAFGGVKQIIKSLEFALGRLDLDRLALSEQQADFFSVDRLYGQLKGFRHRIYQDRDLVKMLLLYDYSLQKYGSLKAHFLHYHDPAGETVEQGLSGLIEDYRKTSARLSFEGGPFFNHMLNSPAQKSACKRWLMFLKWMVRDDDQIDLGLWAGDDRLRAEQLMIPMDTHLMRISQHLRLTRRRTPDFKTALEVTRSLKKIDAKDPTRFDFSLCRWGMVKGG